MTWSASEPRSSYFRTMRTLRVALLAIPLALVAATVAAFLVFGLSGEREPGSTGSARAVDVAGGRLLVAVEDGQAYAFEITVRFESDEGSNDATLIQPSVSMTMVGHDMGRTPVRMLRRSDGSWRGAGTFPMGGRWRFQIAFDGEIVRLDHTAG